MEIGLEGRGMQLYLTPEQLSILEDALECASDVRLNEFDENRHRAEIESMQAAIRAGRDVKRFKKMLLFLRQHLTLVG